jgi:hypothetical protein
LKLFQSSSVFEIRLCEKLQLNSSFTSLFLSMSLSFRPSVGMDMPFLPAGFSSCFTSVTSDNLYEPCVLYIGRVYRYPPDVTFYILTCICLWSRLFGMTLEISRTACNIRDITPGTLTATDTCIGYHVTRFKATRNVILQTRYVSTCV